MAEERQPSAIKEGDQAPEAVPAAAEDRKAAAALDSLDARGQDDGSTKTKADSDALDNAMQKLDVGAKKTEAAEKSKVVKVELADVNLLVDQLDVTKAKATELLKTHDADAVKAMTAWVTSSA